MINVMFVDLKVFTDARVKKLAERYQWSKRETLGALLEVWSLIYVRHSAVIADDDIDVVAGVEGFASALVAVASLARRVEHGIHLKGADAALELRARLLRENDALKPAKKSESSNARVRVRERMRGSVCKGVEDVSVDPDLADTKKMSKGEKGEIVTLKEAFVFLYKKHHRGESPSWNKGDLKNLLAMTRQHGDVVVLQRMRFMFTTPPSWLQPPFTMRTLIRNFDSFVPLTTEQPKTLRHGRFEPLPNDQMDRRTMREVMEDAKRKG